MKKSVEILGLPIISITEGRELGMSKSLLIDAKNGMVAALTIEDDDWYRGVKLIPYEAIIAIGEDAVTITHSENILTLDEAGDYERLLTENVRVIGTKAITKSGRIQGTVTEVIVGEGGRIAKCEITTPDGSINEVTAEQISIFGKQVTVVDIDEEKKNNLNETPAFQPAFENYHEEPAQDVWTPNVEDKPTVDPFETPAEIEASTAALEEIMTPEPIVEIQPVVEEVQPVVEEVQPVVEEVQPVVEEVQPVVEEVQPVVEEIQPVVEEIQPVVEEVPPVKPQPSEDEQKLASVTQQAADLKAALQKARSSKKQAAPAEPKLSQRKQVEKAVDERRRRVLLGKHATKTIATESGTIVVEAGGEVTEEVLQRARLANKFIELSMNVQ